MKLFNSSNTNLPLDNIAKTKTDISTNAVGNLLQLSAGEMFEADILDVINSKVNIRLSNGQMLSAILSDSASLNIGQHVTFMVKENNGTQISLKPIYGEVKSFETAIKALELANISTTQKNIDIVSELITNKLPIDKESINTIIRLVNMHSADDLSTIIDLSKNNIPVTNENINFYNELSAKDHFLSNKVNEFSNQILDSLKDDSLDLPTLKSLINIFTDNNSISSNNLKESSFFINNQHLLNDFNNQLDSLLSDTKNINVDNNNKTSVTNMTNAEISVSENANLPVNVLNSNTGFEKHSTLTLTNNDSTLLNNVVANNDNLIEYNPKEILNKISLIIDNLNTNDNNQAIDKNLLNSNTMSKLDELLKTDVFSRIFKDIIDARYVLDSEFFEKEPAQKKANLEELYIRLNEDMKNIIDTLKNNLNASTTKPFEQATVIKNSINFINSMNYNLPYIQIPFRLEGQDRNSDLYIYNNTKKSQYKEGDLLTAFLSLDLDNLGATNVKITMQNKSVTTNFTLDNDESMNLVEKHLPQLKKRLEDKGYSVKYSVESTNEIKNIKQEIFSNKEEKTPLKRYTFDVRA